jgi:hypothetical protein
MVADDSVSGMSDIEIATMLAIATHLELSGTDRQRRKAVRLLPFINAELSRRRARNAIARLRKAAL